MRVLKLVAVAAVLVGCSKAEKAAESEMAAPAMAAMASVADFAGTWNTEAMVDGTPDAVKSVLMLGSDGNGTMTLEGRSAIPITTSMSGDSLVSVSAEYESVLRKGVMVSTRTATVMVDGMLKGNMVATYKTPEGPVEVKGTVSSTKAP